MCRTTLRPGARHEAAVQLPRTCRAELRADQRTLHAATGDEATVQVPRTCRGETQADQSNLESVQSRRARAGLRAASSGGGRERRKPSATYLSHTDPGIAEALGGAAEPCGLVPNAPETITERVRETSILQKRVSPARRCFCPGQLSGRLFRHASYETQKKGLPGHFSAMSGNTFYSPQLAEDRPGSLRFF